MRRAGAGPGRSSTTARYFVDTNVLVYAFDPSDAAKHERAKEVVNILGDVRGGVLSAQVLMEFHAVVTRRLTPPIPARSADRHVQDFLQTWDVVALDGQIVLEALRGMQAHGFALWDAQIWAAARMGRAGVVLSEDFSDGRIADGVRFVNPFTPAFQPASLA